MMMMPGSTGAVAGDLALNEAFANSSSSSTDKQQALNAAAEQQQNETKRKKPLRQRHYVLARENARHINPSAVFEIYQKYFDNKKLKSIVRTPLEDVENNTTVTDTKDRVEVLARAYAKTHSSVNADVNVQDELQREMNDIPEDQRKGRLLTLWEVRTAIDRMKRGKCSDFLGISAEHLKLLNDNSLKLSLPWLGRVVEKAVIPTHWKTAHTTPLAKPKKDLSKTPAWRPVSVTAVCSRLCESIMAERILQHLANSGLDIRHMLAESQYGFRRGLSPAVMLAGLSMFVEDGIADKTSFYLPNGATRQHANASLLVGVDGVDAFCRANGAIAVKCLKDAGLHAEAFWIANFLTGRSLRVKEDDELSDAVLLESGVPQGTILGPLLWSLVINGLLKKLELKCDEDQAKKVISSVITYADDINFVVKSYDHAACITKANELLQIIHEWSVESGVPLGKMQSIWIAGITGGDAKYNWAANWTSADGELVCGDLRDVPTAAAPPAPPPNAPPQQQQQQKERTFKILGIKFSPSFRFVDHAQELIKTARRKLNQLRALSTTCNAAKVKVLYEALVLQPLLYGCECWYPYIDAEHRKIMEQVHLDGCRLIVRAIVSSSSTNVYPEAGFRTFRDLVHDRLVSLAERIKRLTGVSEYHGTGWVKKLFFGTNLPRNEDPRPVSRIKWIRAAHFRYEKRAVSEFVTPTIRDLDDNTLADVDPLPDASTVFHDMHLLPDLDSCVPPSAFDSTPPGGLVKSIATEQELSVANRTRINELNSDSVFIYPDGSAEGGVAGAVAGGAVIYFKNECVKTIKVGHGLFGCSYTAEIRTIESVLKFLVDHADDLSPFQNGNRPHIYIVTDSRSSISALSTGPLRQDGYTEQRCWLLMAALASRRFTISFHFIFSHCGVKENDEADEAANEAREEFEGVKAPIWRQDAVRLRRSKYHLAVDAKFTRMIGPNREITFPGPLKYKFRRADEQLLYRARVGAIPEIGGHLQVSSDPSIYDCPLCRAVGVLGRKGKTLVHLQNCPSAPLPQGRLLSEMLYNDEIAALRHLHPFREARFKLNKQNENNNNSESIPAATPTTTNQVQHEQVDTRLNVMAATVAGENDSDRNCEVMSETDSLDSE